MRLLKLWTKIILFTTVAHTTASFALEECKTHEPCPIGQECACTISPSSAYDRYFYFDFNSLQPKQHYLCTLNSAPMSLTIVLDGSTFPNSVTYQCQGSCPHFPVTLTVDTDAMTTSAAPMIIKYFVPANDYPAQLDVSCMMTQS